MQAVMAVIGLAAAASFCILAIAAVAALTYEPLDVSADLRSTHSKHTIGLYK
jgi:hypothetical protein